MKLYSFVYPGRDAGRISGIFILSNDNERGRVRMHFLHVTLNLFRLPIEFGLLTFHYLKGIGWLTGISVKRKLGMKTNSWPFGCFSQKTKKGPLTEPGSGSMLSSVVKWLNY